MSGKQSSLCLFMPLTYLVPESGAYCAAVIISLLNLPLELPSDSPAKVHETDTLFTRIPEYIRRCKVVPSYS
jgi:hypothetical protein